MTYNTHKFSPFANIFTQLSAVPGYYMAVSTYFSPFLIGIASHEKAVFIDEMPWLYNRDSDFLPAFDYFWNSWVSSVPKILSISRRYGVINLCETRKERVRIKKVVFLDIEGVLFPFTQYRYDHINNGDMEKVYNELHQRLGVDYRQYNIHHVSAVYYDWDKRAISELKRILDTTGAKIVLSSSWRDENNDRMRDFFRIHDMHEYFIDSTIFLRNIYDISPYIAKLNLSNSTRYQMRFIEISLYLHDHPEITHFVVIDDMNLRGLGNHFVQTSQRLTPELANKCIAVLSIDR